MDRLKRGFTRDTVEWLRVVCVKSCTKRWGIGGSLGNRAGMKSDRMDRRAFLGLLAAPVGGGAAVSLARAAQGAPPLTLPEAWSAWKAAFLSPEGRVIDHGQSEASHSEGQGYGMLLAIFLDDAEAFTRMRDWTEEKLAVRRDPLLAWRWLPQTEPNIADYNNATDGDLFYAWALARAAARFAMPGDAERAREIAVFLAESCVVDDPRGNGALVLLPALERFAGPGHVTLNLSYTMPLALRELATFAGQPRLARCAEDGLAVLAEIGARGLVPDWIDMDAEGWRPSAGRAAVSGYDALRVPLWLVWSGVTRHPVLERLRSLQGCDPFAESVPTVRDLAIGTAIESSTFAGYRCLTYLLTCPEIPPLPYSAAQPYFPATLQLFLLLAGAGRR